MCVFSISTRRALRAAGVAAFALTAASAAQTAAWAVDVQLRQSIGGVCPECDFSGRDLEDAPVIGNLPRANFSGAILAKARIGGNFAGASFFSADLTGASLQSANFANADFSGVTLDEARIVGANFYHADFTGAKLRDAAASASSFASASFLGAKMGGAHFDSVRLSRAVFTGADLTHASLSNADLAGARFEDATLVEADLDGADVSNASFQRADLTGAMVSGTDFSGADLSEATGLTPEMLASACGDAATRLPAGITQPLAPCPPPDARDDLSAWAAWRGGFAPFPDSDLGDAFSAAAASRLAFDGGDLGFAAPGARSLRSILEDIDASRLAARRLETAEDALGRAYTEAHAGLDLDVRDSISSARTSLAELNISEIVNSDAHVQSVIDELEQAKTSADSPSVRMALGQASTSLRDALDDISQVRERLHAVLQSGYLGSIDDERARRGFRFDRALEARNRKIDREIDARLRALDAECHAQLAEADAGSKDAIRAQCRAQNAALESERDERRTEAAGIVEADRERSDAELAELAHQLNLIDERYQ